MTTYLRKYLVYIFVSAIGSIQTASAFIATSRISGSWNSVSTWMLTRTGHISSITANGVVVGTGTQFTTELSIGQKIMKNNGTTLGTISCITDNTHLTLSQVSDPTYSGEYTVQKVPESSDDAIINDITVVNVTEAFNINNLTIGRGRLGVLTFSSDVDNPNTIHGNLKINNGAFLLIPEGYAALTLNVDGNITVDEGGTISATTAGPLVTHFLNLSGNFTNNGTCSLGGNVYKVIELSFVGAANAIVSGTGNWSLDYVTINKSDLSKSLEIQAAAFSNALEGGNTLLVKGTFIHNCTGTWNYMDDTRSATSTSDFSINSNSKVWIKQGTVNFASNETVADVNPTTTIASGEVLVDGGTLNIATGADNYFNICSSNFTVNGGTVNIGITGGTKGIRFFKPTETTPSINITGGSVNVFGTVTGNAIPFTFSVSGGALNLKSGSATQMVTVF